MTKQQEPRKGFVIVCPERGVYLGDGRWSDSSKQVRGHSKNAPVFAGTDADREVMEAMGEGLEFKEVTHAREGFVSMAECEQHGCPWKDFGHPEEEAEKKPPAPKKKKRR